MTKIYSLVQLAKAKQGITSDNAFAIQNGFTRAHINNWKAGLASPSAVNYLKLAKAAGLDIDQALSYIEEETKKKEAGFTTLPMLGLLGAGSIGAMSLLNVTPLSNGLMQLGVFATFATLYTLYEIRAMQKMAIFCRYFTCNWHVKFRRVQGFRQHDQRNHAQKRAV